MFDRILVTLGNVQRRRLLLALLEANPRADRPIDPGGVTFDEADDLPDGYLSGRE